MLSLMDFVFLEGWDWEIPIKGKVLSPGDRIQVKRFEGKCWLVATGILTTGHDDAKYTTVHLVLDGRDYPISPYFTRVIMGWTSWVPFGWFNTRYDTLSDIYGVAFIPTNPFPVRRSLEMYIEHPERVTLADGSKYDVTATVAAFGLVSYIFIRNEARFMESLKKLRLCQYVESPTDSMGHRQNGQSKGRTHTPQKRRKGHN